MRTPSQPDRDATTTIVHVARFSPEYGGSFVASIVRLRQACRELEWELVLVLPETAKERSWLKELLAAGWQIRFVPVGASTWRSAWILTGIISRERACLVHTHYTDYDVAAWLAVRLARTRRRRVQLVWHIRSELAALSTPLRRAKSFIKYRCMGRRAWMIPVGESVCEGAIRAGAPRDRVHTIPNGIDLARVTVATKDRSRVFSELGVDADNSLVLMFGTQPSNKGVDLVLDAVARLAQDDPSVVLGIVGRQKLRDFVRERLGEPQPSWLHVIEPVENVADLYSAATVFVSASRSEGFSFAAVEAMANGLPVVLSDIPGVAWAHESQGAVFFQSGDSNALASSLRRVLDWNPDERAIHSSYNRRLATTEYDVGLWADRVTRHYSRILGLAGVR